MATAAAADETTPLNGNGDDTTFGYGLGPPLDETTSLNGNGDGATFGYGAGFGPIGMERRNSKFRRQSSAIHALSTAEHLAIAKSHAHEGHRRQSIIDVRNPEKPSRLENMYGAVVDVHSSPKKKDAGVDLGIVAAAASQIPAIVIACAMSLK